MVKWVLNRQSLGMSTRISYLFQYHAAASCLAIYHPQECLHPPHHITIDVYPITETAWWWAGSRRSLTKGSCEIKTSRLCIQNLPTKIRARSFATSPAKDFCLLCSPCNTKTPVWLDDHRNCFQSSLMGPLVTVATSHCPLLLSPSSPTPPSPRRSTKHRT